MNSKQLHYAITLSEFCNFSLAAEHLNISQPALSKQILSLEAELGVKLFDRNKVPLALTPAGEHFIFHADSLLFQEKQLISSLEQYQSGERGRLSIGVSPYRNLYLMPDIIKRFKEKYPGVQVVLHEAPSDILRRDTANGKFDFAILNLPVEDSLAEIAQLKPETVVLAVPNTMLSRLSLPSNSTETGISFSDCINLPFVAVAKTQEMRRRFDDLCASSGTRPEITIEVAGGITAAWSMARAGLGATLLPHQFAGDRRSDENLTLLSIKDAAYARQPAIVTRRGQYLSKYAEYAVKLLSEF